MPELLVEGKWLTYKGNTSTRKLYVRAFNAFTAGEKSFYCYDFTDGGRYRKSRQVTGISITKEARDNLPYVSLGNTPREELPLVIVLENKLKNTDKPANPKQLFGDKKPDLRLLPLSGQLAQWAAHRDGANKYGEFNWRENPVEANTYINAAKRHLELFAAGEGEARDTGVNNLGAVMACCAILIDAELHGTLIDNRIKSKEECDALHVAESMVQKLREAQEAREVQKTHYKQDDRPWREHCFGMVIPDLSKYECIDVKYNDPTISPDRVYRLRVHHNEYGGGVYWSKVSAWRPAHD